MLHAKKSTQSREELHLIVNNNEKLQKEMNYLKIEKKNIKEEKVFYKTIVYLLSSIYADNIPKLQKGFLLIVPNMQEHAQSLSSLSKNFSKI